MRHLASILCFLLLALALFSNCGRKNDQTVSYQSQIVGEDNLEFIEEAKGSPLYELARSIAAVDFGNGRCTGFRIGKNLFMTNRHCWENTNCSTTVFKHGFERDLGVDQQKHFACSRVEIVSQPLDYAIYRVTPIDSQKIDDYPVVTLSQKDTPTGQLLFVAGYPFGNPFKRMDRSANCKIIKGAKGDWLEHSCDTDSGSSGSPVFDRISGHVVGIHWGYLTGTSNNNGSVMGNILADIEARAPGLLPELTIAQ